MRAYIIMKRINLSNMLKAIVILMFPGILISCSSSGSDDWPKLEADQLWQELDQGQFEAGMVLDNSLNDNETNLLPSSVTSTTTSLSDIDTSLNEIENKLVLHEKNIQLAVDKFDNASGEDKDLHLRGIEIEKSRLNNDISILKNILYQLTDNQEAESERRQAAMLLNRAEQLMPDINYDAGVE